MPNTYNAAWPARSHQTYMKPPPEYSTLVWGSTNASQSDACVGSRPIDWHLYRANAIFTNCPRKYTNFCPHACVPSITLNAEQRKHVIIERRLAFTPDNFRSTHFAGGWTAPWPAWWWAYRPSWWGISRRSYRPCTRWTGSWALVWGVPTPSPRTSLLSGD